MPDWGLDKVRPIRLSEQIADRIRILIVREGMQPGDRLPSESELTEALSVSRLSVREALRTLESRGLIEVRPGTGAFVAPHHRSFTAAGEAIEWLVSQRDWAIQLLQAREGLEVVTASLATSYITDDLLVTFRQILEREKKLAGSLENLDEQVELDVRFHVLIAHISKNTLIEALVAAFVRAFCDSNRAILYLDRGGMSKTLEEHEHIIVSLASGDPARAEEAARAHIKRVRADVERLQPDLGTQGAEADTG